MNIGNKKLKANHLYTIAYKMTTLQEINELIEEKKYLQQKLWLEMETRRHAMKEAESEWEAVLKEIRILEDKRMDFHKSEINEEEKAYVIGQLKHLEIVLNQPNVIYIQIHLSEPDYESKTLNIKMTTEFLSEGLHHDVSIWSCKKAIIDLVASCIHVPISESLDTEYQQNYSLFSWNKKDNPITQMFKV